MTEPQINITLTIGGRNHVIATTAGEEAHLRTLAGMIDDRVRQLGVAHNQTEARMLLIAALVLADEVHGHQHAEPVAAEPDGAVAARIAELADRVENLAQRLEQSGATS
jgi:cell division protein ZapA